MFRQLQRRVKRLALQTWIFASMVLFATGMLSQSLPVTHANSSQFGASTSPTAVVKATPRNMPTIGLNGLIDERLNYTVNSLADACGQMFAGGHFVSAHSADGKTSYARNDVFEFNESTGVVNTSFKPQPGGSNPIVFSVLPTSDCHYVYIAGSFTSLDGNSNARYLVKYDLVTNTLVSGFNARANGAVKTVVLWNGKLIVGGDFTTIGGCNETALAALDPNTGTNTGYFSKLVVAGQNPSITPAPTGVRTIAISPTATYEANTKATVQHMVMAGNWTSVAGYSRGQVAMISLGATATLTSWDCTLLHAMADPRFSNYLRGISFMPDGNSFYLASSGGGSPSRMSDMVARFEMKVTGQLVSPTWINYTGGDSLWTVAATPGAIYVTGHERWASNPLGHNTAGPGAISRPGIGAMSPTTGLPLSWNPNRSRNVGGESLLATSQGLWVGSDGPLLGCATPGGSSADDCTGQTLQPHPGIGFLPY